MTVTHFSSRTSVTPRQTRFVTSAHSTRRNWPKPSLVRVELTADGEATRLVLWDDGKGFSEKLSGGHWHATGERSAGAARSRGELERQQRYTAGICIAACGRHRLSQLSKRLAFEKRFERPDRLLPPAWERTVVNPPYSVVCRCLSPALSGPSEGARWIACSRGMSRRSSFRSVPLCEWRRSV